MTPAIDAARYRWWILAVFVLSSAINYLDRQSLATLAPLLRADFHLSREQYGWILGAFSVTYAASAPFAGIAIDRIGLTRGISLAVGFWSCAGIATGFTTGLAGLVGCRAVLGAAEAGGIPSAGKAIHTYSATAGARGRQRHQPGRRQSRSHSRTALGHMDRSALRMAHGLRPHRRPRSAVDSCMELGRAPLARPRPKPAWPGHGELLRDRRLWAFVAANALSMVGYSLWTNWTTQYLVDAHHLTLAQAAWYAWIPPLVAMGGGFAGGWFSLRLMGRGMAAPAARFRVCIAAAVLSLATAAIPQAPNAAWASAGISLSIFAVSAFSVNTYTLPLDTFGGARAAFAISMLVASYGAIQLVISPLFGAIVDRHGYGLVTDIAALTPMAACAVLWGSRSVR